MDNKKILLIGAFVSLILLILALSLTPKTTGNAISESNSNIRIDLPQSYQTSVPGEEILFTVNLMSLSNEQRRDITLKYTILSPFGEPVVSKSETLAVETQASFVGRLKLPKGLQDGRYQLRVSLEDELKEVGVTETTFMVENPKSSDIKKIDPNLIKILILVVLALSALFIFIKNSPKLIEKLKLRIQIRSIVRKRSFQ